MYVPCVTTYCTDSLHTHMYYIPESCDRVLPHLREEGHLELVPAVASYGTLGVDLRFAN